MYLSCAGDPSRDIIQHAILSRRVATPRLLLLHRTGVGAFLSHGCMVLIRALTCSLMTVVCSHFKHFTILCVCVKVCLCVTGFSCGSYNSEISNLMSRGIYTLPKQRHTA